MKIFKHTIGGQERTFDVGKMYFLEHFGKACGGDPMKMNDIISDPGKMFMLVAAIVFAGINTHYKASKSKEFVSLEDVNEWVGSMEEDEAAAIIQKYADVQKKEPGEA